jgi:segregation and condensation protein B
MDDISREPPPASDPGRGTCRKGPPELSVFEAGDIDRMSIPDRESQDGREPKKAAADADALPPLETEEQLARALMGVLLASREALSFLRLAQVTDRTPSEVEAGVGRLGEILAEAGLPLELQVRGERVRLFTKPEVYPLLRRLKEKNKKKERLSAAALETLAVVAYRQPVMRAEIEAIRGVQAGPILRTLLEHRLLKVVGRADVPGRPLQYGTTQHFLDRFGLESLDDLPSVKEFRSLG